MTTLEITNKLREAIKTLRSVTLDYDKLTLSDKKHVRHTLYQQEGMFAKMLLQGDVSTFEQMISHAKLLEKRDETSE